MRCIIFFFSCTKLHKLVKIKASVKLQASGTNEKLLYFSKKERDRRETFIHSMVGGCKLQTEV